MLGWMILFALMALLGTILMVLGHPAGTAVRLTSSVFAVLFVLGLLTRAARERAW
jgi:hypothetical protein